MQPISSQTSQLRNKFSQLTDLLQNTALQRGISLSEVAVPATRKPSKDQPKRSSLDEIRTNFRSFTQGSSSGAEARNAPLRRVSTGAITPAFMKEKDRKDKALLESLGVADAGAGEEEESAWQASSAQQPVVSQLQQSSAGQQGSSQDRNSTNATGASSQLHSHDGLDHSTGSGSSNAAPLTAGRSVTGKQSAAAPIDMSDIHFSSTENQEHSAAAIASAPTAQAIAAEALSKDSAAWNAGVAAPQHPAASIAAAGVHDADTHNGLAVDSAANVQGQSGAGTGSAVSSQRPSWVTEGSHTTSFEKHSATAVVEHTAIQPQSDVLSQPC